MIYPEKRPFNYLEEYSKHYNCVEVDQWFWSLFPGDTVVLPKPEVVREYVESVPQDFRFGIKVPNSITLTHHYKKKKTDLLVPNPCFLSSEFMLRFLECLEPLHDNLGPLMLQFEYLNKQKMSGGLPQFEEKVGAFVESLAPKDDDVSTLVKMLPYMESRGVQPFTFVNNHFEGSAPRTIERIEAGLE